MRGIEVIGISPEVALKPGPRRTARYFHLVPEGAVKPQRRLVKPIPHRHHKFTDAETAAKLFAGSIFRETYEHERYVERYHGKSEPLRKHAVISQALDQEIAEAFTENHEDFDLNVNTPFEDDGYLLDPYEEESWQHFARLEGVGITPVTPPSFLGNFSI